MSAAAALLERFAGRSVLVIGDAMLDTYFAGSTHRLCGEAPVPVVDVATRSDAPGGAANVAANVAALGGHAILLSALGRDAEGDRLLTVLRAAGVATADVAVDGERDTLAKQRVVCAGHLLVRFDRGSTTEIGASTEAALLRRLTYWLPKVDAVVISDYDYGVLTDRLLERLGDLQRAAPRVLVVDSKRLPRYRGLGVTASKPNYEQAAALLGPGFHPRGRDRGSAIRERAADLFDQTGARLVVVTLDADGAIALERGRPSYRAYAPPMRHARAAGAGDTFAAALALALAAGADTPASVDIASAAAATVVGKDGTAVCSPGDLGDALNGHSKLIPVSQIAARAALHRERGRRIVLTNGCFDILHRGHIAHLNQAKELGDLLIVAVNSDASVHRLKGSGRPVNPIEDRGALLAALSCIDYVVPFDDDLPDEVIRAVRPDVFVKGGNYQRDHLPEAALVEAAGGIVRILPLIDDRSTTGIIRRIRRAPTPEVAA